MSKVSRIAFANLRAEMGRNQIDVKDLAVALGISRETARRKLRRESPLTLDEAFLIKDTFFPYAELNYLFVELNKAG